MPVICYTLGVTRKRVLDEFSSQQITNSESFKALCDSLLFSLFTGKFESFDEFNKAGEQLSISFASPFYRVLILRATAAEADERPFSQWAALSGALPGRPLLKREMLSHVICLAGYSAADDGREETANLPAALFGLTGVRATVGVSAAYADVRDIGTAHFEATIAIGESFSYGSKLTIFYEGIAGSLAFTEAPAAEFDQFRSAVKLRDAAILPGHIERVINRIRVNKLPSLVAHSVCVNMVHTLITESGFQLTRNTAALMYEMEYLQTLDDFRDFMLRMLDELSKTTAARPSESLLDKIYTYVAEHYDSCNFSVQETAVQLGVNGSYMSQYFKQQTGQTLLDYITSLRIRKAGELLAGSTMPLAIISESVGYYNLNSFIRRFKQVTGLTPGEYRKAYRAEAVKPEAVPS